MGFFGSSSGSPCGFQGLVRRKQVDSAGNKARGDQLAKHLSVCQLIPIGVGSTIGAGVYVLVGEVARERSGPALTISFLIAGIAAALSAFCYAELASRCPSAGSAYHYSYICVGEGIAWIVGWALILEYTVGGSAVARGISPNLALFFGGEDNLPAFLVRRQFFNTDIIVDPCAAILVLIVTALLCAGIKESAFVQSIITYANVCVMAFVIIAGSIIGFRTGWPGYELANGYFPYGINGMLGGAATVFFSYIGFDTVASTAEEVKNPQRDLPLGIGIALSICSGLYMLVSAVIVGIVPYYSMDPDTPISSAFSAHGLHWAMYVVTVGAVAALSSTLMGSILPQPRILMAMARDGLLPSFFSKLNRTTSVPVNSTILTGVVAALLAFSMDVGQLAGMVSVGTLLAFTIVAVSILILRYVPPDEVPVSPSLQSSEDLEALPQSSDGSHSEASEAHPNSMDHKSFDQAKVENVLHKNKFVSLEAQTSEDKSDLLETPLILKQTYDKGCVRKSMDQKRRKAAALSISALVSMVHGSNWSASIDLWLGCTVND
uniref:Cationic amino acid transporter C-terminal domain-containing protein n=1 Tax=Araucaria cunninghamii TaxID=56994 RepID=A0A0D6R5L2_ARACU